MAKSRQFTALYKARVAKEALRGDRTVRQGYWECSRDEGDAPA